MTIQTLMINQITVDHGLQTREAIHDVTVKEYQEAIETMADLPPVTVFHDGNDYRLADGFHRLQAHKNLGRDRISARVISGSRRDAFLHALAANAEHGLRRSQSDKRRAVQMALEDNEIGQQTNREIAKLCKVSHTFVNSTRESLKPKDKRRELVAKTSNWPKAEARVETFPHDLSDEDILHEPYTELDEARDINKSLAEELERTNDRVAIAALDATEEEKQLYAKTLEDLRAENKTLSIMNHTLTISRDEQMNKNSELIRQCNYLDNRNKKLNQQITKLQDELSFYRSAGGTPSQNAKSQTYPSGTPAI